MRFGLGQTTQDYLNLISQYESQNKNVVNYKYATNPSLYSAQGYYQITNTNWVKVAPLLGIDTTQYPNAMSAPQDVQAQVATYLLTQTPLGVGNWANFNPNLNAALSAAGMQTSGPVTGGASSSPSGGAAALVDLSGGSAITSTQSIMDQLQSAGANITANTGIDLTDPTTEIILAGVAVVAALLIGSS